MINNYTGSNSNGGNGGGGNGSLHFPVSNKMCGLGGGALFHSSIHNTIDFIPHSWTLNSCLHAIDNWSRYWDANHVTCSHF